MSLNIPKVPPMKLAHRRKAWFDKYKQELRLYVVGGGSLDDIEALGVPRQTVLEWGRMWGVRTATKHGAKSPEVVKRVPSRESLMNRYFANLDKPGNADLVTQAIPANASITDLTGGTFDDDE